MGTDVTLIGPARSSKFELAAAAVRAAFDREDRRFSRFRVDSELSVVNARSGRWTAVSSEFAAVVALAVAAWRATGGRFDPTVLRAAGIGAYVMLFLSVAWGPRVDDVDPRQARLQGLGRDGALVHGDLRAVPAGAASG